MSSEPMMSCMLTESEHADRWILPNICSRAVIPSDISATVAISANWQQLYIAALSNIKETILPKIQLETQVTMVQREIAALKSRCMHLENHVSMSCLISTFAPEPYKVLNPIPVVIVKESESYVASFIDANMSMSGDTEFDAFSNLRDYILDAYESLSELPVDDLGPMPFRQLAIIKEYLKAL